MFFSFHPPKTLRNTHVWLSSLERVNHYCVSLRRQCFVFFSVHCVTWRISQKQHTSTYSPISHCAKKVPQFTPLTPLWIWFCLRWFCSYGYRDPMGLFFLLLQLHSIRIEWPNSKKSKVKVCFVFVCIPPFNCWLIGRPWVPAVWDSHGFPLWIRENFILIGYPDSNPKVFSLAPKPPMTSTKTGKFRWKRWVLGALLVPSQRDLNR